MYSRLYSRDKYVRPYDKATFVHDLQKDFESLETSFEDEFSDLEKLANDCIQRRTSQSSLAQNRRRNRYQDIVPFDSTRVILEEPLSTAGNPQPSNYINASLISDVSDNQLHGPSYIAAQGPSEETIGRVSH